MSPKPARNLINLTGNVPGLAGHYQWEKEVLIDYIASRFLIICEDVEEDAAEAGICDESEYIEMLKIAAALRKHPNAGMSAKIELDNTFGDLRDFVEWSKEELANYLLHQIVKCELTAVFESRMGQHQAAEEISNLAHVIYLQENEDGFRKASSVSDSLRALRDARRVKQAPVTELRSGPVKPAAAKPARTRAAA
jgi:hypothetical protein